MEQENLIYETTLLTDNLIQNALIEERTDFSLLPNICMKPLNSIRFSMVSAICRLEIKPSLVRKMSLSSFFLMLYIPFPYFGEHLFFSACSFFSWAAFPYFFRKITGYSIDFLTALEVCCTHFLQIPADQVISGLFQKLLPPFKRELLFLILILTSVSLRFCFTA